MSFTETEALTVLTGTPLLGVVKIKKLLSIYGTALGAINHANFWQQECGFTTKLMTNWKNWYEDGKWLENLELVKRYQAQIITYKDPLYPKKLLTIPDHPLLLYVQGTLFENEPACIAVIGTRNASIYGNEMAFDLSSDLAEMGYTIVSGLARGIDTSAHKGALQTGRTIAVIGSGLGNIYPFENTRLAKQIIEKNGALISEFPMNTPPDRQNFPQRNRIVSGMSEGCLLIEAPLASGAMHTMRKASEQKERKLFAIPGRADQENFFGNLSLLKNNKAHLIQNAQDIVYHLDNRYNHMQKAEKPKILLTEIENKFLSFLPKDELTIDRIENLSNFSIKEINVLLMSLVLKSAIKEYPGKIYKRLI